MVTPSKEKARLDAAKAAAKPAAPTPTVGGVPISVVPKAGQSYTPVATKTAPPTSNFTYGSGNPQYVAPEPIVTKKTGGSNIPAAKSREQVAADTQAIADKLAGIKSRVDALGQGTTVPGGGLTPGKKVLRTIQNPDGTTTIVYDDGSIETSGTPNAAKKAVEKIPNIAYDTIQKILESYRITGLASVLESIRDEYPEANSEELITLLQFDSRYNAKFNERFAGNVARQKAGLSVLSPSEYLKLEESYKKVFTAYNLPKFNNQEYYDKFIVGDIDPTEVNDRINLAYDRVLGDDPVNTAFKKFYPSLGLGDIVTGMLDPVNQLPALQRKVKAAEIGGAALRQGFTDISETATSMTVGADVLAGEGLTKAQAETGYRKIAEELPQAEKFSSIYGRQTESYGRLEAEKDQLQGLASEERKKRRLIALEAAQFSGDSGTSKASVNTNYLRKESGAGQY